MFKSWFRWDTLSKQSKTIKMVLKNICMANLSRLLSQCLMTVYATWLVMLLSTAIRSNYLLCKNNNVTSNLVNVKFVTVNIMIINIEQVHYVTIMGVSWQMFINCTYFVALLVSVRMFFSSFMKSPFYKHNYNWN